jgi:transposase
MDTRDFRSIGRSAQEALRRRALFLIEHEGLTQAEAARVVGVQRQAVNIWLRRYRTAGEDGVRDGRRVSPRRGKGMLSEAEAKQVGAWIVDKTPDQLKLPFALWTTRVVRDLIEQRFGKRLGLSTMHLYLQRWGLSPQKTAGPGQGTFACRDQGLAGGRLSGDCQARQGGESLGFLG